LASLALEELLETMAHYSSYSWVKPVVVVAQVAELVYSELAGPVELEEVGTDFEAGIGFVDSCCCFDSCFGSYFEIDYFDSYSGIDSCRLVSVFDRTTRL
jgi:hypothetical protein